MARKSKQELLDEQAAEVKEGEGALGIPAGASPDRIDTSIPFSPLEGPKPDGTKRASLTPEEEKAAMPPRYRVMRDVRILQGNCLTMLRANKVIDSRHYNLEHLKAQGAELELVKE